MEYTIEITTYCPYRRKRHFVNCDRALKFANELGLEVYFNTKEKDIRIKGRENWISLKQFFPELQLLLSDGGGTNDNVRYRYAYMGDS